MQKYPCIDDNILITEMIAGIMIHLFYDDRIQKWEIATKGSVGCKYYFRKTGESYSPTKTTYYRMFLDALCATAEQELNDVAILDLLPKNASYTFILQHPENSIIIPVMRPVLYLISVYNIEYFASPIVHFGSGSLINRVEYIPSTTYENWKAFENIRGIIEFPKQYNNYRESYTSAPSHPLQYDDVQSTHDLNSNRRGYIFTNRQTGERAALKCSKYEELMNMKSILPIDQYTYLCLHRIGKEFGYLDHFPHYKKKFYKIRNEYIDFIANVYRCYMNYFVHKNTKLIDELYYTHIVKLHKNIYLPSLYTNNPVIITRKIVIDYFNKMEPRELSYILWKLRGCNGVQHIY